MIRFEISRMRSKGTKTMMGAGWCTVRQQAWTEELHIQQNSLFWWVFNIQTFPAEGAHVNTQVSPVREKGSVPHLNPADSPAFLSSPLSGDSCVSTPKWQKEQREKTKGRNETQLHTGTTGNQVTWTAGYRWHWAHGAAEGRRSSCASVQRQHRMDVPSEETRESSDGHQKAQMDAHQKAQMDGHQKVAQELLEARAETTHAGWSPAQPHVRHRDGKSWDVRSTVHGNLPAKPPFKSHSSQLWEDELFFSKIYFLISHCYLL